MHADAVWCVGLRTTSDRKKQSVIELPQLSSIMHLHHFNVLRCNLNSHPSVLTLKSVWPINRTVVFINVKVVFHSFTYAQEPRKRTKLVSTV